MERLEDLGLRFSLEEQELKNLQQKNEEELRRKDLEMYEIKEREKKFVDKQREYERKIESLMQEARQHEKSLRDLELRFAVQEQELKNIQQEDENKLYNKRLELRGLYDREKEYISKQSQHETQIEAQTHQICQLTVSLEEVEVKLMANEREKTSSKQEKDKTIDDFRVREKDFIVKLELERNEKLNLEKQTGEMTTLIKSKEKDMKNLQDEISAINSDLSDLKSRFEYEQEKKKEFAKKNIEKERDIELAQLEMEHLKQQVETKHNIINELKMRLNEKIDREVNEKIAVREQEFQNEIEQIGHVSKTLGKQIIEREQSIANLSAGLSNSLDENKELKKKYESEIEKLQKELKNITAQKEKETEELILNLDENWKIRYAALIEERDVLREESAQHKQEVTSLQEKIKQYSCGQEKTGTSVQNKNIIERLFDEFLGRKM